MLAGPGPCTIHREAVVQRASVEQLLDQLITLDYNACGQVYLFCLPKDMG